MANVLNGSTFYIDTQWSSETDEHAKQPVHVSYIIVTATAALARVVLSDVGPNGATKVDLRVALAGESQIFHFRDKPMVFPKGIKPVILSNAVVTVGLTNIGG